MNTDKSAIYDSQKCDFIKEQYAQYHQIRRQHNGFVLQVPSIVIVAVLLFLGLDPKNLDFWERYPLLAASSFFLLATFTTVMLVFHRRNKVFVENFERVLSGMEREFGKEYDVYSSHVDSTLTWYNRIRSSRAIEVFLAGVAIVALVVSVKFVWQVLSSI